MTILKIGKLLQSSRQNIVAPFPDMVYDTIPYDTIR